MAGEAFRQLNPGTEGFAAKNVLFKSPLVIDETGSVDIITSLKPVAFNDMMNSEWYSFVIASHDGSVWTEICSGQVQAGAEHEPCQIKILRGRASANVNLVKQHESHYVIHLTMLDRCLQLMSVAGAAGVCRRIIKNAIPSSVEHLLVRSVGEYMDINVDVKQETGNFLAGDATAMFEDKVVLSMKRGMLFSHGSEGNIRPIPLMAQPPQVLLPHFEMSKSLLETLDQTNTIAGIYMWALMSTVEKEAIIEDLRFELVHEEDPMIPVVCMERIYTNCEDIMADKIYISQNMQHVTLDIRHDPLEQGFAESAFNLIIASNVLRTTPSLTRSLEHIKKLLSPNGYILLHELHSEALYTDYIMPTISLLVADRQSPGIWANKLENPNSGVLDEGTAEMMSSEVVD
ncbi:polyketide synthase [Aspergillus piperis CBS 112811]|uniref:Polyketide synthase n=1 Tax=Aspergillus piperis CBS 112811 TaxID=1448313 RepID=A0A8G1R1A7_9EURO|nr:polyketide synthase [Aspergillus piperis CBS 112811]RAH56429.1 polyketide synthase [Aspergillus piperis CBS 112811]